MKYGVLGLGIEQPPAATTEGDESDVRVVTRTIPYQFLDKIGRRPGEGAITLEYLSTELDKANPDLLDTTVSRIGGGSKLQIACTFRGKYPGLNIPSDLEIYMSRTVFQRLMGK